MTLKWKKYKSRLETVQKRGRIMENRKVLCVTRKYPPEVGGMENYCYNVFSALQSEDPETKIIALGKNQKHLVWFFPYAIFYVMFNAHKYDVLLLGDGLMCFVGVVAKLFSKRIKRMTIIHGLDFLYKNPIYQAYIRLWLKKSSDVFVCNSRGTLDALNEWGIPSSTVITPGIDVQQSGNNKSGHAVMDKSVFLKKYDIHENDLILITVGRLVKRKGVEWFVTNVMSELKDKPVKYLIIGEGNERANIEKAISSKQLHSQVKMLGRISDEELEACYRYSDVFIMPNIHVDNDMEGFGMVALEASLNGLIVLAAGIEGITDAIIDGKNGYLLESENAKEYISFISDMMADKSKYKENVKKFSEYTADNYSWEYICGQYKDLISEV